MARTTKKRTIRRPSGTIQRKPRRPPKPATLPDLAPCYFCKRDVLRPEFECAGCGEVVCDDCDELAPWGAHDPFEHTAAGSDRDADA
jgi:hypothetical protein